MKNYFFLQFTILNRRLEEIGIRPWFGYLIFLSIFIGGSYLILSKEFVYSVIYSVLPIIISISTSKNERTSFLKNHFKANDYRKVRFIENGIITIPFIITLLFFQEWLLSVILLYVIFTIAIFDISFKISGKSIPTPYAKKPFEFASGFRTYYFFIIALYILNALALIYKNLNFSYVCILGLFLICMAFYGKLEDKYLVWIHDQSPKQFLAQKIKIALQYSISIIGPAVLVQIIVFKFNYILAIVLLLGILIILLGILSKYSNYPHQIDPAGSILIAFSFIPPVIIFVIPYFYFKSINALKENLHVKIK